MGVNHIMGKAWHEVPKQALEPNRKSLAYDLAAFSHKIFTGFNYAGRGIRHLRAQLAKGYAAMRTTAAPSLWKMAVISEIKGRKGPKGRREREGKSRSLISLGMWSKNSPLYSYSRYFRLDCLA